MTIAKLLKPVALAIGITAATVPLSQAEDFSKSEIEEIVHQYILENPEVIGEAFRALQLKAEEAKAQQEAQKLEQATKQLINNPIDPVGGNIDGEITIVEFFDYNCGYCKRANEILQQLIANNPDLRVVYKEWPILSEHSKTAAEIALAVNLAFPEKYETFHRAMLKTRSIRSEDDVWKVVDKLELDQAAIKEKLNDESISEHISTSTALAQQLGITGTPAFIVGNNILKGAYPLEAIQEAIEKVKAQ